MARQMWFGTREFMQWVPCPVVERPSSQTGWYSSMQYLNGGAYVRNSWAGHRRFEMSWNLISREDSDRVSSYSTGAYGTTPIYWIDPMAANYNVLPVQWAFPGQSLLDAPSLGPDGIKPVSVPTPLNTFGYPTTSVQYTFPAGTSEGQSIWIPIPPGHTAHVGFHGQQSGSAGVQLVRTLPGGGDGSSTVLVPLPVTTSQRFNTTVDGDVNLGLTLRVRSTGVGTLTMSGLMVQVLPTGRTPEAGNWLKGRGASGCKFLEHPEEIDYSLQPKDFVGLNATLVEVGSWL